MDDNELDELMKLADQDAELDEPDVPPMIFVSPSFIFGGDVNPAEDLYAVFSR